MVHNNQDLLLLHLVLIPGIGPAVVERLLGYLSVEQFDQLYSCTKQQLMQWGLSELIAEKIVAGLAHTKLLESELKLLEKHRLTFVSAFNSAYPELLRHVHLPPLGLYVWGELPREYEKSLAVVGSRQAQGYAREVIQFLIPPLIEDGWVIVSGGAVGADTMAHETTLAVQGTTVAVIGSGLLRPYPMSNKKLFERIVAEGGAVVSSFPLLAQGLPHNFPARNRIIAGMTRGCLVIQASEKSGALITAAISLKEGREVFAVPGSIFDPLSVGCHQLIDEGAAVVRFPQDIIQACGFPVKAVGSFEVPARKTVLSAEKVHGEQPDLPPLVQFCHEPRSIDALLEYSNCSFQELSSKLWEYQVGGLLEETASGMWRYTGSL